MKSETVANDIEKNTHNKGINLKEMKIKYSTCQKAKSKGKYMHEVREAY